MAVKTTLSATAPPKAKEKDLLMAVLLSPAWPLVQQPLERWLVEVNRLNPTMVETTGTWPVEVDRLKLATVSL